MIALGLLVALGPALTLVLAIVVTARFASHRSRMRDASDARSALPQPESTRLTGSSGSSGTRLPASTRLESPRPGG